MSDQDRNKNWFAGMHILNKYADAKKLSTIITCGWNELLPNEPELKWPHHISDKIFYECEECEIFDPSNLEKNDIQKLNELGWEYKSKNIWMIILQPFLGN